MILKTFLIVVLAFGIKLSATKFIAAESLAEIPSQEIYFEPPKDGTEPDTRGLGTRNPDRLKCDADGEEIKAIMPESNYGLTLQARPTIFIHLPETSAERVVLSFQDETEDYHETVFLPIVTDRNIASFSLPEDKLPLESNKYYKWKLTVVCNDIPNVEDPKIEGWVKRIDNTNIAAELAGKNAIAKANWYAKNGYWYDLLTQVYSLQKNQPTDSRFTEIWHNLLDKVGIQES